MDKVNTGRLEEAESHSPNGRFQRFRKDVSVALGREPQSTDLLSRHPFDVAIMRVPPGRTDWPYHAHSAQWEFYHVISGRGTVRHDGGTTDVTQGDAFLFKPGEAHHIVNSGDDDLVFYVIADNPIGAMCYYPDSNKWSVPIPEPALVRSAPLDYYADED
jgi:uncharacterized cupin superfamily protein